MALEDIFNVAGSALNAQTTRMNTTASNLANAATVAGSEDGAFRAKRAVFKSILADQMGEFFPEIKSQQQLVTNVIREEEASFLRTLEQGLQLLEKNNIDNLIFE